MNTKRFLLAALAVYVVGVILSYLINGVILASSYEQLSQIWRPDLESKIWITFLTAAFWAVLFTYIFTKGYEGRGLMEGVRYGLIMGLFFMIPYAYDQYAVYPIPYSLALQWFIYGLLFSVICGVVVAAIYRPAAG